MQNSPSPVYPRHFSMTASVLFPKWKSTNAFYSKISSSNPCNIQISYLAKAFGRHILNKNPKIGRLVVRALLLGCCKIKHFGYNGHNQAVRVCANTRWVELKRENKDGNDWNDK